MTTVLAILNAKPGCETQLQQALQAMVPKVKSEPDALTYTLHRAQDNPGRFFFYEVYATAQAFEYHTSTDHFKELVEAIGPLLADEPQIEVYERLVGLDDC